jgi:multimeric flavodoxin WrbA
VLVILTFTVARILGQAAPEPARPVEADTVRILVAYDSLTGNTEKMAEGVVEGVDRVPGVVASLKKVGEVTKEDLENADGIVLGCPTYYGSVPGRMKVVIDDWSWGWARMISMARGDWASA